MYSRSVSSFCVELSSCRVGGCRVGLHQLSLLVNWDYIYYVYTLYSIYERMSSSSATLRRLYRIFIYFMYYIEIEL